MKIVLKNSSDKPKIISVTPAAALPVINNYLGKKQLPPVSAEEMALLIKSVAKVSPKEGFFTLAEIKHADGSYIKIIM